MTETMKDLFNELENEIMLVSEMTIFITDDQGVADSTMEELKKHTAEMLRYMKKIKECVTEIAGKNIFLPDQRKTI